MDFRLPTWNGGTEGKFIMAALVSGALSKMAAMAVVARRHQRLRKEGELFELVGRVGEIRIHPLKGSRPLQVSDAFCADVGPENDGLRDRHWMLLGPDGKHVNIKTDTRMTLVRCQSAGDFLRVTAPGMPPLDLPKDPDLAGVKAEQKMVLDPPLPVIGCGEDADKWFRTFLQKDVQLVFSCQELGHRSLSQFPRTWEANAQDRDKTIFSFRCSYMLISASSFEYLSQGLPRAIPMDNFRPNIVIHDSVPFDEDSWEEIRIGSHTSFHVVEPCRRCFITTVNAETAEKDKEMQPLKHLKSFRCYPQYGHAPLFGIYIANDNNGTIRVGDPVYVKRNGAKQDIVLAQQIAATVSVTSK